MSELTREVIATQERPELEPVASKDRDTATSTAPSMASTPGATTPPERATAGILVSENYLSHPWVGPVGLDPVVEKRDLEILAAHGLPADAKRAALSMFSENFAFGPYDRIGQSYLQFLADYCPGALRRRAVEDLVENECVLVESEGPEGAPRTVNGKELRLRPWVLSIGWAQEGALPKWVFTYIKQLDSVFVHEPSRVLAVWRPYSGPGAPDVGPEAYKRKSTLTEEEADVRTVRALLANWPMGSASLSCIARHLGLSPRIAKSYLDGLTARLDFVYYTPGKTVRIYELAKARMWLLDQTEGSPRRR